MNAILTLRPPHMLNRPLVMMTSPKRPPPQRKHHNRHKVNNSIIHRIRRDRHNSRHDEDDAHKKRPRAAVRIDEHRRPSKVPWARYEVAKDELTHDWDAVTQVQGDGAHVEDAADGRVGTETDEVDGDAEQYAEPDRGKRGASLAINPRPHAAKRQKTITRKGEDGAGSSLQSGEADEFNNDEPRQREEDPARFAEGVVEDLCDGLVDL